MTIKIVLLGDMNVGKSTFITKYITGLYKNNIDSTLGASFFTKKIIFNEQEYTLEIWDTAGQERYRSLAPMYYRNADVALIFFDLSRLYTYKSVNYWKNELSLLSNNNLIQIVVGNKLDLIDINDLPNQYKKHFLISVKENIDIDKLVNICIEQSIKIKKNIASEKIKLLNSKHKNTKSCC
jgi:small GTP-binding protein